MYNLIYLLDIQIVDENVDENVDEIKFQKPTENNNHEFLLII